MVVLHMNMNWIMLIGIKEENKSEIFINIGHNRNNWIILNTKVIIIL